MLTMIDLICPVCDSPFSMVLAKYNYNMKHGCLNAYCNRNCAGIGRRLNKSTEQKAKDKRLYDTEYRKNNFEKVRLRGVKYNESIAGRATQKRSRDKRKQQHLEYCQTPEYKAWKKKYDQKHQAKKVYGEFWESAIYLNALDEQVDKYEANMINDTYNKSQKRKRNLINYSRKI